MDRLQPVIQPLVETACISFSSTGVRLGPPVPAPEKIIVTGANYQAHFDEASGVVGAPSSSNRSSTLSRPIPSPGLPIRLSGRS
jgi:hypothetical protein